MEPFTSNEILFIREKMWALATCEKDIQLEVHRCGGLEVEFDGTVGIIRAEDRSALARGLFQIAHAAVKNEQCNLKETRHFTSCGAMLDMSRGAVMKVDALKEYLNAMAALGLNMVQLYTEDTYTVPEYPYFGYLRGRYTPQELRKIDDYADSLGIEVIPCIQTLAHLENFLQWSGCGVDKDQPTILLLDDPKTYAFIEAEIKAIRACFRSKRIHIGMDEALGVGLGKYFEQHGLKNRFELLNHHLKKVVDICKKYDYQPMMWSDMFFRLGSKTNDYYDLDVHVPDDVIASIPDVQMVYWDYYNKEVKVVDAMLTEHQRMKANPVFAGGIWTWSGFLPNIELTEATMRTALSQCLKHSLSTVFATMWGDDGAETCLSLSISLLPLFSETCWKGAVPQEAEVRSLGEAVSGISKEAFEAWKNFYNGSGNDRNGKGFLYCDLLYPLVNNDFKPLDCAKRMREGQRVLEIHKDEPACDYAMKVLRLSAHKAEVISALRTHYKNGDRDTLRQLADEILPTISRETESLCAAHRKLWMENNKRNGWETLALRYGAIQGRLEDVRLAIEEYLEGRIAVIDELEEEPLPSERKGGAQFFHACCQPSSNGL